MSLCEYKNLFGEPRKGIHANRINVFGLSLASNDVYATIGIGLLLSIITCITMNLHMNLYNTILFWLIISIFWIIIAFILGILLHWLFCVETELNNFIFK